MEGSIPLSEKAKRDLAEKIFYRLRGLEFIAQGMKWAGIGTSIGFLLGNGIFFAKTGEINPLTITLLGGMIAFFAIGFLVTKVSIFQKEKAIKKEVEEENLRDFALSKKVESVAIALKENPPDLKRMTFPELIEAEGLKPVRIEEFPQEKLEAEFSGLMRGIWDFLVFGGEIFGEIKGGSTPDLVETHTLMICQDEKGDSLRLVCPNFSVYLANYLRKLIKEFGIGSYCQKAFNQLFWEGEDSLRGIYLKSDPQRIYDFLVTRLELPLSQRPSISIKGVEIRKGIMDVFLIGCEGREDLPVIPIDSLREIQYLLEEKLEKSLPPVLSLPSGKEVS